MFFRNTLLTPALLATSALAGVIDLESRRAHTAKPSKAASGADRLVIYWGAGSGTASLDDVCADPSYGIVNLSFLDKFEADGGFPSLAVGDLSGPSEAQQAAGATSLKDGSSMVQSIQSCQSQGKLVILSIGGAIANVELASDEAGEKAADMLWNLFGGGKDQAALRPFGDLKLDGFDLDNESGNPTGYMAFVNKMRQNFETDSSKKYYMTAAPQCPFPDQSMPQDVCQAMDYVWVQFYNNGDCNVGASGFMDSVKTWSSGIGNAKLFIGALASDKDGDKGYVDAQSFAQDLGQVKQLNLPNYSGAMLWEASLAVENGNYQKTIAAAV